jgi:hypothetical protein
VINLQENGYIGNTNALKYKTEEQLKKGIDKYFEECDLKEKPYTMSGLAYSLGIDRATLVRYGDRDLFATQIKKAKQRVQAQLEENALMGKGNATFTIFNLKNNYGWKDNIEVEGNTQSKITIVNSLPKDDEDESNN